MQIETMPQIFAADATEACKQVHGLIEMVLGVEQALAKGQPIEPLAKRLRSVAGAPSLCAIYLGLSRGRDPVGPIRRALVGNALQEVELLGKLPVRWFVAEAEFEPAVAGSAPRLAGGWVRGRDGGVFVRRDQMLAASGWGVGYRFTDSFADAALATAFVQQAVQLLSRGLVAAADIDRRGQQRTRSSVLDVGFRYERLMLAVLNEHGLVSKPASLAEDLFEKTDLWLTLPELHGERARVQVSIVGSRLLLQQKLRRIARPQDLVLLTPRTLAVALEASSLHDPLIPPLDRAALRSGSMAYGCFTTDRLATYLKSQFLRALDHPTRHPLGPMAEVPSTIRLLVQRFAAREALRSVRARKARGEAQRGFLRENNAVDRRRPLSVAA